MSFMRKCPVCGEVFTTKYAQKRICCAECVQEYEDIKRYLGKRMNEILLAVINEARTTNKKPEFIVKEYYKKW